MKKNTMMSAVKKTAVVTGGAWIGTKVSDLIEKQIANTRPDKANAFAPLITSAIGLVGMMFVKNENLQNAFLGMTVVSGAETLEKFESSLTSGNTVLPTIPTASVQGSRVGASEKLNGSRIGAGQKLNGYRKY